MLLKKATLVDLAELKELCVKAYSSNFYTHWEEGGLAWYLEREFSEAKLTADLENSLTTYYFILENQNPVGFIKTQENSLPNQPAHEGMELVKMYMLPASKGKGIGQRALAKIIKITSDQNKKILFLCVIDTNTSAIAFYEKLGFKFHSKIRLDLPYFKEELRGMHRMYREIS